MMLLSDIFYYDEDEWGKKQAVNSISLPHPGGFELLTRYHKRQSGMRFPQHAAFLPALRFWYVYKIWKDNGSLNFTPKPGSCRPSPHLMKQPYMAGHIDVDIERGKGTVFSVFLPVQGCKQ